MKVLLSIQPEYVEKIFSGEKKFEYRKSIFKKDVESILIYATKPIGKIVGEIFFTEIISGVPISVWDKTYQDSGISKEFFLKYYLKKEIAYAIKIDRVIKYEEPKNLPNGINAPQSFCYISMEG